MPPIPAPAPTVPEPPTGDGGGEWEAVLLVEGVPTADGRMFLPDSVAWRPLPLTLMAQLTTEEGHNGAIIAGRIDSITRQGAQIIAKGVWDTSEEAQEVKRLNMEGTLRGISVDVAPQIYEYEVPAFIDPMPVEEVEPGEEVPSDAAEDEDEPTITVTEDVNDFMMRVVKGELGAATVCTFPAYKEATIETLVASGGRQLLRVTSPFAAAPAPEEDAKPKPEPKPRDGDPTKPAEKIPGSDGAMIAVRPAEGEADALAKPGGHPAAQMHVTMAHLTNDAGELTPEHDQAIKESMSAVAAEHPALVGKVGGHGVFPTEDGYANVHLADVPHISRVREALTANLRERGVPYSANHGFTPHLTSHYSDDLESGDPAAHGVGLTFATLEYHKGGKIEHSVPLAGLPPAAITAAAAGAVPVEPPHEWFRLPEADGPTPLTVTDDGQVYGHIATWGTCHIGLPGGCTEPPPSRSSYAYFNVKEVRCAGGERVACGTITMRTKHAPLGYSRAQTTDHYDHTGTAAADVTAVDGQWGIWVCGALRPDLQMERVREFRGAAPSGDWREINGHLEMVGVLAVNVPGFPVQRPATRLVASGERVALVAGGTQEPQLAERWQAAMERFWTPDLADRHLAKLRARLAPR